MKPEAWRSLSGGLLFTFIGGALLNALGVPLGRILACPGIGLLLALAVLCLGLLNPFIIMLMMTGVGLVAPGVPIASMPVPLLILVQVLIGFSLRAWLRQDDFAALPRSTLAGVVCSLILISAMVPGVGSLLHLWTNTDMASLSLAVAPGGLGEMISSAKAVDAASALV